MNHPLAAGVQDKHAPAVLANRLLIDQQWGRPCLAYNVCILPGAAAAPLSAIQARVLSAEPSLLRIPERALHANVVWLLPVHEEFDLPKDELWQRHGSGWLASLADVAGRTDSFRVRYRRLVATNSAVIAVAEEPNRISAIRRELRPVLGVPGSLTAGELVHVTLFRYTSALRDPASLMNWLAATEFDVSVDVSELVVVRERIFPSLDYEVLHRLPLRHP
ncbi:MAG: hypothetical protein ACM3ML_22755 [Micromonosporaceae bacterium]